MHSKLSLFFIFTKKRPVPDSSRQCDNANQEGSRLEEADEGPGKPGREMMLCEAFPGKPNTSSWLVCDEVGAQPNLVQRDDRQLEPLLLRMSESF